MKRSACRHPHHATAWPTEPYRLREFTPVAALPRPGLPSTADHDFLVPNPRPDLTLGLQTLRMIQIG